MIPAAEYFGCVENAVIVGHAGYVVDVVYAANVVNGASIAIVAKVVGQRSYGAGRDLWWTGVLLDAATENSEGPWRGTG